MKKFMPMAKKNDRRGANLSISMPRCDGGTDVFAPVGQGEGQLLHEVRARLLHVVARDRDRVELRGISDRRVLDDIGHDPHRGFGRVDIGVPDHELLEDVVLDGSRKRRAVHPLFLARRR